MLTSERPACRDHAMVEPHHGMRQGALSGDNAINGPEIAAKCL